MTSILTTFLFVTFLSASSVQNYENFNITLDKLSKTLSVEQRTMLYLLALSIQNNITASKPYKEQEEHLLVYISELNKIENINQKDVEELRKSYVAMTKPEQTILEGNEFYFLLTFVGMLLGFIMGYFKFKKRSTKMDIQHIVVQHSEKDKKIIKDLQDLNNKLKKEINLLKLEI